MMMLKYYISNENLRKIANIFTCVLMLVIVVGRVLSGVHWASDIIGGIIISCALLSLLNVGLVMTGDESKNKSKE